MKNKISKALSAFAMITLLSGVFGCGSNQNNNDNNNTNPDNPGDGTDIPVKPDSKDPITTPEAAVEYFKIGDELKRLPQTKVDVQNMVFDGFSGPLNRNKWGVAHSYWGHDNGGLVAQNTRITESGELVLKAHGDHYMGDVKGVGERTDGTRTGAGIISKFYARPGHYEIKMKVTPRIGCCTAFWTFSWKAKEEGSNLAPFNSELDIELPGGGNVGDVSLEKCINTNWYTENMNESQQFKAEDFGTSVAHNDGEWHTYGFDWYSDPGIIVYHYDGLITNTSITNLPTMQGRLNIGVWFPQNWTGQPNFEEDYMLVDSVKYEPFKDQPIELFESGLGHASNTDHLINDTPIALQPANKISNGNFEFFTRINKELTPREQRNVMNSKGWKFLASKSGAKLPEEQVANIVPGAGIDGSCAAKINDNGVLRQEIDSTFKGYKYNLNFMAKTKLADGQSNVTVKYLTKDNKTIGNPVKVVINNVDTYRLYEQELVCPENCRNIRIEARTSTGNELFLDNANMFFVSSK